MIVHALKHVAAWFAFLTVIAISGKPETIVPAMILFVMAYLIGRASRPPREEAPERFTSETTVIEEEDFGPPPPDPPDW